MQNTDLWAERIASAVINQLCRDCPPFKEWYEKLDETHDTYTIHSQLKIAIEKEL